MSDNQQPNAPKKNIFDFDKLFLVDKKTGAKFRFSIYQNNPRVIVYTNNKEDKEDYGRITGAMTPIVFNAFLTNLTMAANSKEAIQFAIDNLGHEWSNGKRSEQPVVLSTLKFGKNEEGVVWVSLTRKNRPVIVFEIGEDMYHHLYRGDGTRMSKSEISRVMALGYIKTIQDLFNIYTVSNYEHIVPTNRGSNNKREGGQGGQGGGYNRGGNGGGGYQRNNNNGGGYNRGNNNYQRNNNDNYQQKQTSNYTENTTEIEEEDLPF